MDYHHQWITKTTLQENSIEELEKNISDGLWIIVPESNSNQSETMLYNGKPIYNHEQLIAFTMHYSGMKREAVEIQIKRYFINGLR